MSITNSHRVHGNLLGLLGLRVLFGLLLNALQFLRGAHSQHFALSFQLDGLLGLNAIFLVLGCVVQLLQCLFCLLVFWHRAIPHHRTTKWIWDSFLAFCWFVQRRLFWMEWVECWANPADFCSQFGHWCHHPSIGRSASSKYPKKLAPTSRQQFCLKKANNPFCWPKMLPYLIDKLNWSQKNRWLSI